MFMNQKTQHSTDIFRGKGTGIAKKKKKELKKLERITLANFKVIVKLY